MIIKILINLLLYVTTFVVFYFYRRGFDLSPIYISYFGYYIFSWGLAALISRKFKEREKREFLPNLYPFLISFILMMGILAGLTTFFKFYGISNYIILSSLLSAFFIEVTYVLYINGFQFGIGQSRKLILSYKTLLLDFIILFWVMTFTVHLHDKAGFPIDDKFYLMMIGILIFWFVSGIFSHQFPPFHSKIDFWRYSWGFLKSYTIFMALLSFTMLQLRFPIDEYNHLFFGAVIYTFWSFIVTNIAFVSNRPRRTDEINISLLKAQTMVEFEDSIFESKSEKQYKLPGAEVSTLQLKEKLNKIYLKNEGALLSFLEENLDLASFDLTRSVILRSRDIYNVEILPENYIHFFMNLHETNDLRRLNAYFIEVNTKLVDGGVFIGRVEPIMFRYRRFLKQYPFYFGQLFYFIDFMWRRVFPKLPLMKKIYFAITQGKNRAISLAESLGRLYYCGFELIGSTEIDDFVYFIARRAKEPYDDTNPSYGPLFKMKRVGKDGKPIFVYKIRTMHPYSEYLMKYVFEKNGTVDGDKIKNDFRISSWGIIFRKLWIDELPMLINLIKGDLKIVGVRPISEYKFSLYPQHLKVLRSKYKPGLIPPYYADLPENQQDFFMTEERYLIAYEKAPFRTDLSYFIKALYNIFVKSARSK